MGKTANTIKMLILLKSGEVIPVDALAGMLETRKRNIYEYRDELEMAGYKIKSIRGPHGGYRLVSSSVVPTVKFSESEIQIIHDAYNALIEKNFFLRKDKLMFAFAKIFSAIDDKNNHVNDAVAIYEKWLDSMSKEEVEKRYNFMIETMNHQEEIEILYNYVLQDKELTKFHVYKVYLYNNAWCFDGLNLNKKTVYYRLRLTRIGSFHKTGKKFTPLIDWEKSDKEIDRIIGNVGYKVIFIARGPLVKIIRERKISDNQQIEELDNNEIKVTVEFRNRDTMLRYIAGARENITVLEPDDVKDYLLEYAKYLKKSYTRK